jgi:serine/threonine protein kinase
MTSQMAAAPADTPSRHEDARLLQALDEYQAALQAGKRPDPDEFRARYPDLAGALAECLAGLEFVHAAGLALSQPGVVPPPGLSAATLLMAAGAPLGDFRIVREIGRGGMGIVYEAEQLSLGRRVALKLLPFAGALDPRQLQRFKNEAQAAAHLHHPNIVPVYGVGCERGVHYYAMQLIEGQTLATMIASLRERPRASGLQPPGALTVAVPTRPAAAASTQPSDARDPGFLRTAAGLGMQAAEALEHAHQLGVVHRDVKPANLLVDARGNLWILDFGLAQIQSDTRLTRTGDLLGTLRYMSPEQALGTTLAVDHRADLYALGATLYELLTLEPALSGNDRHELLRQIAFEEPRPPRKLNRAIPAELETILLKALSKAPEERYATAQEMADDLRRFLEDKPIRARPPTLPQRTRRWARRHEALVLAAGLVLLMGMVALAVSTVLIARQRDVARARERQARQAVDEMYTQVAEQWLADEPHLEALQQEFLGKALAFYKGLTAEGSTDPSLQQECATAYRRMGNIHRKLGQHAEAREAYRRAIGLQEQLATGAPAEPSLQQELARNHDSLFRLLLLTGPLVEAEQAADRAVALREELAARAPAEPAYRQELASSYDSLGTVFFNSARRADAEAAYRKSQALWEQLVCSVPDWPDYQSGLGRVLHNRARVQTEQGNEKAAVELLRQAVVHSQAALKAAPRRSKYRDSLGLSYDAMANALARLGKTRDAEEAYRQSLALKVQLANSFPAVPEYRRFLARGYHNLGIVLRDTGRAKEAEQVCRQALAIQEQLVADYPALPDYQSDLGAELENLAKLLRGRGDLVGACQLLQQAVSHQQAALQTNPRHPTYHEFLWKHYARLGSTWSLLGEHGKADAVYQEAQSCFARLTKDWPASPEYASDLGALLSDWAILKHRRGEVVEASRLLEQAIGHQQFALQANPKDPTYRQFLYNHYTVWAEVHVSLREHGAAARAAAELPRLLPDAWKAYDRAATILAQCAALAETDTRSSPTPGRAQAAAYADQARALLKAAAERVAHTPAVQNSMARFLANPPHARLGDAGWAVTLAEQAVATAPQAGDYWQTLGTAHLRAGHWQAAIGALDRAMKLTDGGMAADWLCLAMACWQLKDKEQAHQWYDRAIQWMEKHNPRDEELGRFRAEAAALLGIPEKPSPTGKARSEPKE